MQARSPKDLSLLGETLVDSPSIRRSSQSAMRSQCSCPQHFGSVFSRSHSMVRMTGKRKMSCLDTQAARASDACPFLPRFLLLHIIFGQCPSDGLELNQPRLRGNLLCRKDWIQLRRTGHSEWAILPIQKVAAYPGCTVCENLRSRNRPEARRALSAHVGWVPRYRCADKVDGPCSGHTDSVCHSEPEHRKWDLDMAGGSCPSVPEPPLPLQSTVPSQPRCLLQELIRAPGPFQPRWSPHGSRLTGCDWLSVRCAARTESIIFGSRGCQLLTAELQAMNPPSLVQNTKNLSTSVAIISLHAVWILCSPQGFGSGISNSSPAKPWEVDAQERSREELARTGRTLAPSMAERDTILELPDPGETAPARWPGWTAPEHQLSPTQPVVRRSETGQTAPPPQW